MGFEPTYIGITIRGLNRLTTSTMVETVRFELTDPFGSTVFKTVAINQTRPRFHIYGGTRAVRTPDQRIKSPLLYRLSYRPIFMALQNNVPRLDGLLADKKRLLVTFSLANLKL